MNIKRIMNFGKNRLIFGCTDGEYAVHFWVEGAFDGVKGSFGGVEFHRPRPLNSSHACNEECWITGKRCYHDGSSSMAREKWIPLFHMCNESNDFESIFRNLERLLRDVKEDDAQ